MTGIGIYELIVLVIIVSILAIPFSIGAIIDILRSNFRGNDKIVWLLVVLFLSVLGIILYVVIGKKQKVKKDVA
jgi:hypothetical protein